MISAPRTDESFLADQSSQDWSDILIRASVACPFNIDHVLAVANPLAQTKVGSALFVELDALPINRSLSATDRPAIAVLLDDATARIPNEQATIMATRYASLAVEKICEVIVFSHQNVSGFERFGFRVERVAGKTQTERDDCIKQLRRFWGIEILI